MSSGAPSWFNGRRMTPEALLSQLEERGIDTQYVSADGLPAVEQVCAGDSQARGACLEALRKLLLSLTDAEVALWTPLHFDVRAIAGVSEGQPDAFAEALELLGTLVLALHERDMDTTRPLQYGIPSIGQSSAGRSWPMVRGLRLATELAERAIPPGELLNQGVPALDLIAGDSEETFCVLLDALRSFILTLDERGVGPHYPIMLGVAAAAGTHTDEPASFRDTLSGLAELATSLWVSEISPYPVFEYGVSAAFEAARSERWLAEDLLPLAIALASQGTSPQLTLQWGVNAIAGLGPERGRLALGLAHQLSEDGAEAGFFFQACVIPLSGLCEETSSFEARLEQVRDLALAMHAHELNSYKTFYEALPRLLDFHLERTLSLATTMARRAMDPGPTLQYGVGATANDLRELPERATFAFDVATQVLEAGLSPWRILEDGVVSVHDVATSDDEFVHLYGRLRDLVLSLHERGADTETLLTSGIRPIAGNARQRPDLFERFLDRIEELVMKLRAAGLDPLPSITRGLPEVAGAAQGAPFAVDAAFSLAAKLADDGVDPAGLLARALPALVSRASDADELNPLLDQVVSVAGALSVTATAEPLEDALRDVAQVDGVSVPALHMVLELTEASVARSLDPTAAVRHALPVALAECSGDLDALRKLVTQLLENLVLAGELELDGEIWSQWGLPRILGHSVDNFADCAESMARATASVDAERRRPLLIYGSRAAATVAGDDSESLKDLYSDLARRIQQDPAFASVLENAAYSAADIAAGDGGAFRRLLDQITRLAHADETDENLWLARAFPAARVAAASIDELVDYVADLVKLQKAGTLSGREADAFQHLPRLLEPIRQQPALFRDLVIPTFFAQGAGSGLITAYLAWLLRYVRSDDAVALLRQIVTQHGTRAANILDGLLLWGLRLGIIGDLGREKDLLLGFLDDVPFADPEYYAEYRRILQDEELDSAARRQRIDELGQQLETLSAAVIAGEVTEEHERHPLFAQVLYYVFPPAYSISRDRYARIYQQTADHPEHVAAWTERGEITETEAVLSQGAYHVREGQRVDTGAWELLADVVSRVNESEGREDLPRLGADLFAAWLDGTLGKDEPKRTLLESLYRYYRSAHHELSSSLDDASVLLKYREFLADAAREIIQDALRAHRAANPESYDERARNKLTPRRRIGSGLVRSIWRTLEARHRGDVDDDTVWERVRRQLRGFDTSDLDLQQRFLTAERDDLPALLEGLPEVEPEVPLGEEYLRVLQDLAGAELAAMQRELFGADGQPGKLEYRRSGGGPQLTVRFELTKRRAHVPIGFNEGVCTASDSKLWERTDFLQVVFWGPDGRAQGGMHALIVKDSETEYLALPGVNPSLELLKQVGAEALMEAILAFAVHVAEQWGLAGVWIPTHRGISSNRGPVRQYFEKSAWPQRMVSPQPFSFSPYQYSFSEVWVAWEK